VLDGAGSSVTVVSAPRRLSARSYQNCFSVAIALMAPRAVAAAALSRNQILSRRSYPPESPEMGCPAKIVGAGHAEVLENRFLIHKPPKSSYLIRKSIY